jgi:hypothetical protein
LEKGVRAALAGAAFLGAVSGAEVPKGAQMPQMQTAEAHESFNAHREALGFLSFVAREDRVGIDDPIGRWKLRSQTEADFEAFAQALAEGRPYFSGFGERSYSRSLQSSGNLFGRMEAARDYVLPLLLAREKESGPNVGLEMLQQILTETTFGSPESQLPTTNHSNRSVIENYPDNDWK